MNRMYITDYEVKNSYKDKLINKICIKLWIKYLYVITEFIQLNKYIIEYIQCNNICNRWWVYDEWNINNRTYIYNIKTKILRAFQKKVLTFRWHAQNIAGEGWMAGCSVLFWKPGFAKAGFCQSSTPKYHYEVSSKQLQKGTKNNFSEK